MRDVVLYTLLSLDGVAEEPGDWMFEADEEVFSNLADVIRSQDDILIGRGTYDYWADYWPTSDVQPFADFVNGTTKHVFTSRALSSTWAQTTIVREQLGPTLRSSRTVRGATWACTGASSSRRACWPTSSSTGWSSSSCPPSPGLDVVCSPMASTCGN